MKFFHRLLVITGALLIVAAMVAHIICLATPNLASMEFLSYQEILNETIKEMNASGQGKASDELRKKGEMNPALFGDDCGMHFGLWTVCMKGTVKSSAYLEACFPWDTYFPEAGKWAKPGWINTVKGFYITGLVLAVLSVILSNTNAHTPSQGDRGRILPILICVTSILTGIIILIGNLIVAFNYSKEFTLPFFDGLDTSVRAMLDKVWERSFTVSWGFPLDFTSALVFILAGLFHLLAGKAAIREGKIRRQEELMTNPTPNYDDVPV